MKGNYTHRWPAGFIVLTGALLFVLLLNSGCSSANLKGSWVNTDYKEYTPKKVLVMGITKNLTARKIFEEELSKELSLRGIVSGKGYDIFPLSFTGSQQSEVQIQREIDTILGLGYDSVLITAVKGVDEKVTYDRNYGATYYHHGRFRRYYYVYQDIYYTPYYYEKYKVYHIESSLFDLKAELQKTSLVWTASFDLVDPHYIESSVEGYIKEVLKNLEKEGLVPKINR